MNICWNSNYFSCLLVVLTSSFLGGLSQSGLAEQVPLTDTEVQPGTEESEFIVTDELEPPPQLTTEFKCINTDLPNQFATIATRGERQTPPMILWKLTQFYGPQQRCNIVSHRLTSAVKASGGKYSNLLLTYGAVNNVPVICNVTSMRGYCTSQNVLLTLAPRDRGKEADILKSLIDFNTLASTGPLLRGNRFVDLGAALEQCLDQGQCSQESDDSSAQ